MPNTVPTKLPRWVTVTHALAFVITLGSGMSFYKSEERALRRDIEANLDVIAQLKAEQIVAWRSDRLNEAADLMAGVVSPVAIDRWLLRRGADDYDKIIRGLRAVQRHQRLTDVLLLDAAGKVQLSVAGESGRLHDMTREALAVAARERRPRLTDLHFPVGADASASARIDAIVPLFADDGRFIGTLVLESDAGKVLTPLIQAWPGASRSAEALLVKADGEAVLFLNELRYRQGTALKLRIPVAATDVPAVQAVMGRQGAFTGRDYRGMPVISVLRGIPDAPWFLVAKIDEAEALADWNVRSHLILAVILAVTSMLAISMLWLRKSIISQTILHRAQVALEKSEHEYRILFEDAPVGIALTTPNGNFIRANPALAHMLGYADADALINEPQFNANCLGAFPADRHGVAREPVQPPEIHRRELALKRRNGESFVADVVIRQLQNDAGNVYYQSVIQDITERKRIADELVRYREELELLVARRTQALHASEDHLAMALEAAKAATWDWNLYTGELVWSEMFSRLLGYAPGEMAASYRACADRVCLEDLPGLEKKLRACFEQRSPTFAAEYRVIWPDGTQHWIDARGRLAEDQNGYGHLYGVAIDITHRKQVEFTLEARVQERTAELESERDFVDTVLGVAPMLVLVVDREGRVARFNDACERLSGLTFEDVAGKEWHTLNVTDNWAEFVARCEDYCPARFESYWHTRDGVAHLIEWHNTCLRDAAGKLKLVINTGIDITEQRYLEKESRQRLEDLAQMHRLQTMGEMAALLAHQLNQPLGAARSFAEAGLMRLSRGQLDSKRLLKTLSDIVAQVERAAQVIRDLRTFLSRQPQELKAGDLNIIARTACQLMMPLARGHRIDIQMNLAESLPFVLMRSIQIEQVLVNLMHNAVEAIADAGHANGTIRIGTAYVREDGGIAVSVRDSGPGLDADAGAKVFEPLYTTKHGGIGLGLPICRSIVLDHGGRIWTVPGRGGDFRFVLPIVQ